MRLPQHAIVGWMSSDIFWKEFPGRNVTTYYFGERERVRHSFPSPLWRCHQTTPPRFISVARSLKGINFIYLLSITRRESWNFGSVNWDTKTLFTPLWKQLFVGISGIRLSPLDLQWLPWQIWPLGLYWLALRPIEVEMWKSGRGAGGQTLLALLVFL